MRWNRVLTATLLAASGLALVGSSTGSAFFNLPLTPGHFTSSNSFAFAGMPDSAGDQASIALQYGQLRFRPKGGSGPLIQVTGTSVIIDLNMADGLSGFGCWLVNGNALAVSSDLTASVTFDSSASDVSPCPGFLVNQAGVAPAPQLSNLDQPQGLSGLQFSVQWTPNQPLDVIHSTLNGTCQGWTSLEQITSSSAFSAANGTVTVTVSGVNFNTGNFETESLVAAAFTTNLNGFAQVSTGTDDEVVNGPSSGSCGPYGS